jgi:hypothetical protein
MFPTMVRVAEFSFHFFSCACVLSAEITSYLDPFEALMQALSKEQEAYAVEQAATKENTSRAGSPGPPMIGIVHSKSKHQVSNSSLTPRESSFLTSKHIFADSNHRRPAKAP